MSVNIPEMSFMLSGAVLERCRKPAFPRAAQKDAFFPRSIAWRDRRAELNWALGEWQFALVLGLCPLEHSLDGFQASARRLAKRQARCNLKSFSPFVQKISSI